MPIISILGKQRQEDPGSSQVPGSVRDPTSEKTVKMIKEGIPIGLWVYVPFT